MTYLLDIETGNLKEQPTPGNIFHEDKEYTHQYINQLSKYFINTLPEIEGINESRRIRLNY